ncbi:GIY-YIG nuclease family protein [Ornithinibacillus massiliensis]|uniref:GIY-YIG nuclease family protein n=1 Tax=Ornithinibacillus massiliensis TaxID=1944633 RepID=A0ABS5M9I0_9BACI|nr:GIY-YIG nuclease family protein [Ornithinibacillus massiliensis]MBS3678964.1 GIY-YIG nuclease family protein [Ornithinibacillus massiliensis]
MGMKTTRKNFTEWEIKHLNQPLSFDDVWELGKEKYRLDTQDLIGIYVFQNIKTNRFYVGSSHHIFGRLKSHASSMKSGKHSYQEINEDFKKHGKESFVFKILTYCNNSQLHRFEKSWLQTYSEKEKLYNQVEIDNWDKPKGRWIRNRW